VAAAVRNPASRGSDDSREPRQGVPLYAGATSGVLSGDSLAVACEQRVVRVLMAVEDLVNRVSGGCTRGVDDHTPVAPDVGGARNRRFLPVCSLRGLNAITTLPITSGVVIDGARAGLVESAPAPAAAAAGPDRLGRGRLRPAPLHP
jgi:hypothetical protein